MAGTLSNVARIASGTLMLVSAAVSAGAQDADDLRPCGPASTAVHSSATSGLASVDRGAIVYDSNQGLCWLADANLAGHPEVRAALSLSSLNPDGSAPIINPDGTMDFETAVNWVNALNRYNKGKGWLGHNNWQLPSMPRVDPSCSSKNTDNFGVQCVGSAMGNLYNVGLARTFPDSVVPSFFNLVWPFVNLQPGLYWTSDPNGGGETTFSFNTGIRGGNTTQYNFFRVLPMTATVLGTLPTGSGVLPYVSGPGVGRAVYDTNTGLSWTLNANLPAFNKFGITSTITIASNVNGNTLTVPVIDTDGAVHFSAINPANTSTGWIVSMNNLGYAGSSTWTLPGIDDLRQLYKDMRLPAGDTRLEWPLFVGPFCRQQPGFYWACVRADKTGLNGPCDLTQHAPTPPSSPVFLEDSFNFDDGFEGTDLDDKQFYVMVYFPS